MSYEQSAREEGTNGLFPEAGHVADAVNNDDQIKRKSD